jgi:tetratricopeptide (TPR) repeat protein
MTNMLATLPWGWPSTCASTAVATSSQRNIVSSGKILLRRGNLQGALVIFDEAADLLSSKTNAGGAALLQKAITLDSLGKSEEALKIYRQLRGHRCLEVAKMVRLVPRTGHAKRMSILL